MRSMSSRSSAADTLSAAHERHPAAQHCIQHCLHRSAQSLYSCRKAVLTAQLTVQGTEGCCWPGSQEGNWTACLVQHRCKAVPPDGPGAQPAKSAGPNVDTHSEARQASGRATAGPAGLEYAACLWCLTRAPCCVTLQLVDYAFAEACCQKC